MFQTSCPEQSKAFFLVLENESLSQRPNITSISTFLFPESIAKSCYPVS